MRPLEIFLRLKPWQVFMATFGLLPIAAAVIGFVDFIARMAIFTSMWSFAFKRLLTLTAFMQTLCVVLVNFWLYAVVNHLHKRRYYNSIALLLFRLGIYFSTFFQIARYVVIPSPDIFNGTFNQLGLALALLIRLYCSFIGARLLNSVEEQRDVSFREIFGDILRFFFYPIGVWQLQPRINRIYNSDKDVMLDPDAPLDQSIR